MGKAINTTRTYSESMSVTYIIQHAMSMRLVILPSVAYLALPYFSMLSHKQHDFRKNIIEHKMCVLICSTSFVWNISHSKKNWERYYQKCVLVFV